MPAFATASDLATILQRDLSAADTATAEFLLDLVSAAMRSYMGQHVTPSVTTTTRIRSRCGTLRLPQRPVTAVTAVTTAATPPVAVTFKWDGAGSVTAGQSIGYETGAYLVTYTHGLAVAPDDLRAVVLQVAGRAMGATAEASAVQSESIGSYSYSVGGAAASGPMGFLAGERAVLDRYKLPALPIRMLA